MADPAHTTWAVVVVSVLAVPAWVVMQALFLAWYSAVWTVYWRRVGTRVMVQPDVGAVPDEGTHSVMGNAV